MSRTLCVSRAQLYVLAKRKSDWKDKRGRPPQDDSDALTRIHNVIDKLPTNSSRRVWVMLRRQSENENIAMINAKRVYRIMKRSVLLQERKPAIPVLKRAHTGKIAVNESNQRWCSDSFEFRCDNGEKLCVTCALDCCDREALHWADSREGFDSETVKDIMMGAVEDRFGNGLPAKSIEWLTDNGSAYRAHETRWFAKQVVLSPRHRAVRSP